MNSNVKKFLLNGKGTSTVEFALTIMFFFTVVFMIFELSRIAVSSAYWDLAIADSVRLSKNQQAVGGDYKALFAKILKQQRDAQKSTLIGYLALQESDFNVDVKYADSMTDLINGSFKKEIDSEEYAKTGRQATLALYTLTVNYDFLVPLPSFLQVSLGESVFKREIITVQEYERSQFQYTR